MFSSSTLKLASVAPEISLKRRSLLEIVFALPGVPPTVFEKCQAVKISGGQMFASLCQASLRYRLRQRANPLRLRKSIHP